MALITSRRSSSVRPTKGSSAHAQIIAVGQRKADQQHAQQQPPDQSQVS
jgi:hypothetical protein